MIAITLDNDQDGQRLHLSLGRRERGDRFGWSQDDARFKLGLKEMCGLRLDERRSPTRPNRDGRCGIWGEARSYQLSELRCSGGAGQTWMEAADRYRRDLRDPRQSSCDTVIMSGEIGMWKVFATRCLMSDYQAEAHPTRPDSHNPSSCRNKRGIL